ncbi:MAG: hypothetical protein HC913_11595 [Microscillaceae bacterium]|nr:hypothetical protein [Microscillaceae bacterium]
MATFSIDPSREQIKALMSLASTGPIVMLNLLRFKPSTENNGLSGQALYAEYAKAAAPFLQAAGGRVVWHGHPQANLIAPPDETSWG